MQTETNGNSSPMFYEMADAGVQAEDKVACTRYVPKYSHYKKSIKIFDMIDSSLYLTTVFERKMK